MDTPPTRSAAVRDRIIHATADLLAQGGLDAASTRAISAAASVQPPTLYRQFGDLQGLLDEVARTTLAEYVREKATRPPTDDPVTELRHGWDLHVAFGLTHPAVYTLIYGRAAVGMTPPAAKAGLAVLERLVTRVAQAGRLRVGVLQAVRLIAAGGEGVTLALIASAPEARDPQLSATMREAVLTAILNPGGGDAGQPRAEDQLVASAVGLQAALETQPVALSAGERQLLAEWLDRLTRPATTNCWSG